MFQTVHVQEIFDQRQEPSPEEHPAYWLAQLRKRDWHTLLKFAGAQITRSMSKPMLVQAALALFEFEVCETRGQVRQAWQVMKNEGRRGVVIQFRHPETDWTRGMPEFVHLDEGQALGLVNIAARMVCRLR